MPRFYCDYCDVYLTHDSAAVRRAHNTGRKHKSSVRDYYAQFEENVVQAVVDTRVREYEARESAIRAGLLPPTAPFSSVMPPHPLAPGVPPALPPGWVSGQPPPTPSLVASPLPFLPSLSAAPPPGMFPGAPPPGFSLPPLPPMPAGFTMPPFPFPFPPPGSNASFPPMMGNPSSAPGGAFPPFPFPFPPPPGQSLPPMPGMPMFNAPPQK